MKISDGEKLVLDYLNKQNRPYNQKMIFEVTELIFRAILCNATLQNIHGKDIGISEATVKTICATLAESGQISTKSFNNKPLYWAKQDRHEELNADQLKELDLELKTLKEKDDELKAQVLTSIYFWCI